MEMANNSHIPRKSAILIKFLSIVPHQTLPMQDLTKVQFFSFKHTAQAPHSLNRWPKNFKQVKQSTH